jgi:dCTP diphosphatase
MKVSKLTPVKTDSTTTIQDLKDASSEFTKERGWEKHHTAHNLVVSIAIEAAELMEHFQWGTEDFESHKLEIAHELADVINYCMRFAEVTGIDISTSFYDKLEIIKLKYPTSIFNPESPGLDEYHNIKRSTRQKKKQNEETNL